ncbi:DNA polymerase theta-like [Planoprotostelium fungivorum]|uniref:DNA polymerase theta-like n=1 Tax=Planoprotostelium fungivorum TaxID=1890364 RepID=A0A2P6MUB3_9EUKA|nr:DNA polymerase theta-like [Planoprotostelium fungivorum]
MHDEPFELYQTPHTSPSPPVCFVSPISKMESPQKKSSGSPVSPSKFILVSTPTENIEDVMLDIITNQPNSLTTEDRIDHWMKTVTQFDDSIGAVHSKLEKLKSRKRRKTESVIHKTSVTTIHSIQELTKTHPSEPLDKPSPWLSVPHLYSEPTVVPSLPPLNSHPTVSKQNDRLLFFEDIRDNHTLPFHHQIAKAIPSISSTTKKPPNKKRIERPTSMPRDETSARIPFAVQKVTGDLQDFIDRCRSSEAFSWCLHYESTMGQVAEDVLGEEGTTFLPQLCTVYGIFVCFSQEECHYLSTSDESDPKCTVDTRLAAVRRFMTGASRKILFDMKSQLKLLLHQSIRVTGPLSDPKIAAWLVNTEENKEKSMNQLAEQYLSMKPNTLPLNSFERCATRAQRSWLLSVRLNEILLMDPTQYKLYTTVEMPLVPILARMEYTGFGFLKDSGLELNEAIHLKLKVLEDRAHALAKREFSLTNTFEVSEVLFKDLKLPALSSTKRSKNPSTSKKVLQQLGEYHPLPPIITEHRKLTNTKTKYLDSLFRYAFRDEKKGMDRIYTTVSQTTVPTGRLAFTDPNLQAIPHSFDFFPVEEEEKPSPERISMKVPIRDFFVAPAGFLLLSADYAQIELRFLAHFTGDTSLIESFKSGDVFMKIAAQWLDKKEEQVTKEERDRTKHICYGIIYGMGPVALSEKIRGTKEEATHMIETFKRKINQFLKTTVEKCQKAGMVETILGRRRYIPDIFSRSNEICRAAERKAVNTVCQGSAADLIKKGMIAIDQKITKADLEIYLLVQIHDELIFEVREEQVDIAQALSLSVPLPVRISVGKTWGSMKEYEIPK